MGISQISQITGRGLRSLLSRQNTKQCSRRLEVMKKNSTLQHWNSIGAVHWNCFRCNKQGYIAGARICLAKLYHAQKVNYIIYIMTLF